MLYGEFFRSLVKSVSAGRLSPLGIDPLSSLVADVACGRSLETGDFPRNPLRRCRGAVGLRRLGPLNTSWGAGAFLGPATWFRTVMDCPDLCILRAYLSEERVDLREEAA